MCVCIYIYFKIQQIWIKPRKVLVKFFLNCVVGREFQTAVC